MWDLGGQTSIRPYWRCYYQNTNAVIYVVDSAGKLPTALPCLAPRTAQAPSHLTVRGTSSRSSVHLGPTGSGPSPDAAHPSALTLRTLARALPPLCPAACSWGRCRCHPPTLSLARARTVADPERMGIYPLCAYACGGHMHARMHARMYITRRPREDGHLQAGVDGDAGGGEPQSGVCLHARVHACVHAYCMCACIVHVCMHNARVHACVGGGEPQPGV